MLKRRMNKGYFIRKADKLWSLAIRQRDKRCVICGRIDTLQAAHIFSRVSRVTRWDLLNGLALCYWHHFHFAHKEPILFAEFVKKYLGKEYAVLRRRHNESRVFSINDILEKIEVLEAYLQF